ncbi:MAG: nitrogen fixation negative regulator NifL [Rhodocyclaceae bacterium]|nr:nitrogen fixation negative regulator NifL [Rhodocyclaceae bacterium]
MEKPDFCARARSCPTVDEVVARLATCSPEEVVEVAESLLASGHGLPPGVFVETTDQSSVAISITDASANILYANRAFEAVTGYAPAEVIGRNESLLSYRTTPIEIYREMWSELSNHRPWHGRLVNRRKDGRRYLAELTISPILDAKGENAYLVGIHRDVTEMHHLQHQVAGQKALIETVIDLTPVATVVLDADCKVLLDNHEYKKLHSLFAGVEPAKAVLDSLFARRDGRRELPAGGFSAREFVVERGGGPIRWFSCSGTWFDEADPNSDDFFEPARRSFLLLVMEEITEHKRRQEEQRIGALRTLLAEGELKQSLRETINGAIYQLQEPVNLIEAALKLVERRSSHDPVALAGVLREALEAGRRSLARLHESLPPISQESAAPLNLNEILRDVLSVSTSALLAAGVSVAWRPAAVLPAIPGQATALRTMFKQLIDNALAAMVSARSAQRELRVITEVADDGVRVLVEDTGPGIAEEYRHKIFEPFYRIGRPGGRHAGMGLALVQEVVARHSGLIRVDPAYEEGCRFEVFFPRGPREIE